MPAPDFFRPQAIEALESSRKGQGDLLRISPAWVRWTYRVLALGLAAAVGYAAVGQVSEYATGPALVRADGRTDVTTPTGGTVVSVDVQPGQHVIAGQILARLYMGQELADRDRLEREWELQLQRALRDPMDQASRQALTSLRAQREQAEARLAERSVKAARAGVVSDVRIRPGQLLAAGELVCTVLDRDASFYVIALLPGQYRPMLRRGMPIRLEVTGFQYAYQNLTIDSVGDEVVGPGEVRRYLGQELGDTLPVSGPVVLVRAKLPTGKFTSDDRQFSYYNGIPARADVRVRRQSLLVTLVPALKTLFPSDG